MKYLGVSGPVCNEHWAMNVGRQRGVVQRIQAREEGHGATCAVPVEGNRAQA